MIRTITIYGAALALAAMGLQWIQYQMWARSHPGDLYLTLIATAFLGLGVWAGARLFRTPARGSPFEPNTLARASLGISNREFEVLELLAAGRSNKEIARSLSVSLNTVKTHVSRLFDKLEATRRTQAILKARELGLIP